MQTGNINSLSKKEYPLWFFILLPAITMMLGWGLRGFIGGGPFGAMIPGGMVMIVICMLLNRPFAVAAVIIVFGTAGIAMGGEMTYGQTLGFLRNPDTIWWGTCGTTTKGAVWGFVGGVFIGLGLIYRNVEIKTIITGLLLFLVGFVIGLKLINDPKLIYFSDPFNKPRQESWTGLLFAAMALLIYLKIKLKKPDFRLISRFAGYGLLGGGLGFGLGAFWLFIGSQIGKNSWIVDWWKLMEFSFGFIMGSFFGYAAWRSRKDIVTESEPNMPALKNIPVIQELIIAILLGFFIYLLITLIDPFVKPGSDDGILVLILRTMARVLVNYTFIGSLLIMIAMRWPFIAFQIAITLTFSHTVMDLVEDMGPGHTIQLPVLFRGVIVLLASICVGFLVAIFQRKQHVLKSMFLLLVWSTVTVAIVRMFVLSQFRKVTGDSILKFIIGDMLVFNVFIITAIIISILTVSRDYRTRL